MIKNISLVIGLSLISFSESTSAGAINDESIYSYRIVNCAHPSLPERRLEARFYSSNGLPCSSFYFKGNTAELIGWAKSTSGICSSNLNKVKRNLERGGFTCSIDKEVTNSFFDEAAIPPEVTQTAQEPLLLTDGIPDWVMEMPPPWE